MHENLIFLTSEGHIPDPLPNGESLKQFIDREMGWWNSKINWDPTGQLQRDVVYSEFINRIETNSNINLRDKNYFAGKTVGELCGGAKGGLLCHDDLFSSASERIQIDILASEFAKLNLKEVATVDKWVTCPAEKILLKDDSIDFLIAFNSLDHGWDFRASITEAIRVAKEGVISFDCKGYTDGGSHYQLIVYEEVVNFLENFKYLHYWEWRPYPSHSDDENLRTIEFHWKK